MSATTRPAAGVAPRADRLIFDLRKSVAVLGTGKTGWRRENVAQGLLVAHTLVCFVQRIEPRVTTTSAAP
jgi:hypothetical protein